MLFTYLIELYECKKEKKRTDKVGKAENIYASRTREANTTESGI